MEKKFPAPHVRLFVVVTLIGGAPLIALLLGLRFMPAPAYLSANNLPVFPAAAVLGIINARGLMRYERDHAAKPQPKWREGVLVATLAGLVFVTAYLSAAVNLPMAVAGLAGHDTKLQVVVGKQSSGARKVCRNPVNLTCPHFIFSTLCGVPAEVRQTVNPGDLLTLEGYGNVFGVYYRRVSKEK